MHMWFSLQKSHLGKLYYFNAVAFMCAITSEIHMILDTEWHYSVDQ